MNLRTISTVRLLAACAGVVATGVAGVAIALASGGGPHPTPKPLAKALHDGALAARRVEGVTARIRFTNRLIASSGIEGSNALLSGATGRLWFGSGGRFRLELQSERGDVQIVSDGKRVTLYDASANTAYRFALPKQRAEADSSGPHGVPSIAAIQKEIAHLTDRLDLSSAVPTDVAGRPAYRVRLTPSRDGGLLGAVELAWDAQHGVPLRVAVYARGNSSPVLELKATEVSFGPVASSVFDISPPPGARTTSMSQEGSDRGAASSTDRSPVEGLAGVRKGLPFNLSAPRSLGGLTRNDAKLLHVGGRPGALVTYGAGLGGVAVIERATPGSGHTAAGPGREGLRIGQSRLPVPKVAIGGVTGQELDTALGSVISFSRDGVDYTVLGLVPPATAKAAARDL